jgi:hypothetical protein
LGGEFQINSPSHGRQTAFTDSAAAGNASGRAVVAWSGHGGDDSSSVYARLYDAQGAPIGGPFRVNELLRGGQSSPAVAMADDGSFVVVWSGHGAGDREGVFARWFSATGQPLTGEVRVNESVAGAQHSPAVAMAGNGATIIAYSGAGPGDFAGVFVRMFAAGGQPLGGEQRANSTTDHEQWQPDVAINSSGEFVVAWTSRHQGSFNPGVFAQRFVSSGEKSGDEFQVSSTTRGGQYHPTVGLADSGEFAVAWTHWSSLHELEEVHARVFDETGAALGDEFAVNGGSAGWQRAPSLAMDKDGDFVVGWSSGKFDGAGWEVFARQYASGGESLSEEFQVNREFQGFASGSQSRISTALVGGGDLLFVWTGRGRGDRRGVFGQRFDGEDDGEANRPPDLAPILDVTIDEGETLTFTALAADPNLPDDVLTFALDDDAPPGAAIDPQTGEFTWTPTEAQGPGVYTITVIVTDNGSPPLADSESFTVTVREVNSPPSIAPIEDVTIDEGQPLAFTVSATDPDLPANALTYTLDDDAPEGAAIDPQTGAFSWTPSEAQGPGQYSITVLVTDNGSPPLANSETFIVTVREVNSPPSIAPIEDVTIDEGQPLTFTVSATDPDLPANTLTYTLDDEAPEGATIDPQTGAFSWTPSEAQGPGQYSITVLVTDNGSPPLANSETFVVTVTEPGAELQAAARSISTAAAPAPAGNQPGDPTDRDRMPFASRSLAALFRRLRDLFTGF